MSFKLDPILERDSHHLTQLKLCQIRLMDNSNYPWLILVPMKNNIIEITDFEQADYDLFNWEIRKVAKILQSTVESRLNHLLERIKYKSSIPGTYLGADY